MTNDLNYWLRIIADGSGGPSVLNFSIEDVRDLRTALQTGIDEIERLRADIQELTCGDPRKVCPNCRDTSSDDDGFANYKDRHHGGTTVEERAEKSSEKLPSFREVRGILAKSGAQQGCQICGDDTHDEGMHSDLRTKAE